MKYAAVVVVSLLSMMLSACGVTIEATHVPVSFDAQRRVEVPRAISGEGITYTLPRTDFEIVQPVKVSVPTSGPLDGTQALCRRACSEQPNDDNAISDSCDFDGTTQPSYGRPELRTRPAPDYTQLYQVTPSTGPFQTLKFDFDVASNGVIDKAYGESSNLSYEVVSSIAQAAVKTLGLRNIASAQSTLSGMFAKSFSAEDIRTTKKLQGQKREPRKSCLNTSQSVAKLIQDSGGKGKLTCALSKEIDHCLTEFEAKVEHERRESRKLFDAAAKTRIDSKLLDAIAANHQSRIDEAIKGRDQAAGLYGLGGGKPQEATFQIIIPIIGPREFESDTQTAVLGTSLKNGFARVIGISDNAAALMSELRVLEDSTRFYKIDTSLPTGFAYAAPKANDSLQAVISGYRYRVPVTADTALRVYGASPPSGEELIRPEHTIFNQQVIAQYGPVAALTSKFHGKGGTVSIKHWPDSGGLQTVMIGAESLPTKAVADVVDTVGSTVKARKDASAAAKLSASVADPELDSLTRQQKVLALKKEIRDLEDALNK